MKTNTVNIDHYTIKDIPGSSGRLDVISRCILAALLNKSKFDEKIQFIIFFKKYGTYVFNPAHLDYSTFPKDELLLSDWLYKSIKNSYINEQFRNPLNPIKKQNISFITCLKKLQSQRKSIYILKESGISFNKLLDKQKLLKELFLIIGNQSEDFINSFEFLELNIPEISLGTKSLLASTVIRLLKLKLAFLL
jgi:tRNA (pseudouridine54-N1)-methyltransferase